MRAANAKLAGRHERAADAYRAALRREESAHTRKLLAVELAASGRHDEALAEFLAAERAGEPDPLLPLRIGLALEALNHRTEAAEAFQRFLESAHCRETDAHRLCAEARRRIQTSVN